MATKVTNKETLNEWERMALISGLELMIEKEKIHQKDGKALLKKLQGANNLVITTPK